jgi:hypothetical protein
MSKTKKKTKAKVAPPNWTASPEQQLICDHVQSGDNVVVDACAGSGKSTTILTVAHALPKKRFLQITYNSMLRKEFREKVTEYGLENIEVHTYHSFAVKYFYPQAHTDTGIRHILYTDISATPLENEEHIPKYDIVVLDETQDMTLLYYRFIQHVLKHLCPSHQRGRKHKIQLLILGDYMQGLYEFKGADIRFLTKAHMLWVNCPFLKTPTFQQCTLKTSYRITRPMASFVNHVMLGCHGNALRLYACRDGIPVIYIRNSRTNIERIVLYHIQQLLHEGDLPSDIFVLGASVKGANSNVRKMENALVERGIPCHVPMFEHDKVDDRVIDGKVVFSTFHTVKGRQRKHVFVIGFDHSYFSYYAKNLPEDQCPNTLYVACTRATHRLYLLESNDRSTDQPLRFLKMNHHEMKTQDYVEFKGNPQTIFYEKDAAALEATETRKTHYVTPTELIRFVPEHVLEVITPWVEQVFFPIVNILGTPSTGKEDADFIPSVVCFAQSGLYEDVGDLNGVALPCMYWDRYHGGEGSNVLYTLVQEMIQEMGDKEHGWLKQRFRDIDPSQKTSADYLYLANVYLAVQERLYFKLHQIGRDEYTWLKEDVVDVCLRRFQSCIGDEPVVAYEEVLIHAKMEEEHQEIDRALFSCLGDGKKYRFTARLDMLTADTLWEWKCTQQITMDHQLQVIIYAWLWRHVHGADEKKVRIGNIRTGEVWELRASTEELTRIVVELLRGKYSRPVAMTDEEFLNLSSSAPTGAGLA